MDLLKHYMMRAFTISKSIHEWIILIAQLVLLSLIVEFVISYLESKAKEEWLHYI